MPRTTKEEQLQKQIDELNSQLRKVKKDKYWECPWCSKSIHISKIDLIIPKHFVEDYDGGYWSSSNEFWIVCAKCDVVGRYYTHATHYNPDGTSAIGYEFLCKHEYDFGSIIEMYKDNSRRERELVMHHGHKPVQLDITDKTLINRISTKWKNAPHLSAKETKIKKLKEELAKLNEE